MQCRLYSNLSSITFLRTQLTCGNFCSIFTQCVDESKADFNYYKYFIYELDSRIYDYHPIAKHIRFILVKSE